MTPRRLNQNYPLVLEGLLWSVGQEGLTTGTGAWQQQFRKAPWE